MVISGRSSNKSGTYIGFQVNSDWTLTMVFPSRPVKIGSRGSYHMDHADLMNQIICAMIHQYQQTDSRFA